MKSPTGWKASFRNEQRGTKPSENSAVSSKPLCAIIYGTEYSSVDGLSITTGGATADNTAATPDDATTGSVTIDAQGDIGKTTLVSIVIGTPDITNPMAGATATAGDVTLDGRGIGTNLIPVFVTPITPAVAGVKSAFSCKIEMA